MWHYLGLSPGCSLRLTWGDFHCITCSLFVIGGFLLLTIITIALFRHCNIYFLSLSFIFLNIAHLKSIWLKYRKTNTQNTNTKDAMSALPEELANQPLHLKSSPWQLSATLLEFLSISHMETQTHSQSHVQRHMETQTRSHVQNT